MAKINKKKQKEVHIALIAYYVNSPLLRNVCLFNENNELLILI